MFWVILFIFRQRNLNQSIRRSNKALFRKASIAAQLVISVGFSFCTITILKQMYFLHHSADLGFSFHNRGAIIISSEGHNGEFANHLKQIPEIVEIIEEKGTTSLAPLMGHYSREFDSWDDKPVDAENLEFEIMFISPEFSTFYDFQLTAGEMLSETDPFSSLILINESAAKALGWNEPVGKHLGANFTVKGIIKDVCNFAPTMQAIPTFYLTPSPKSIRLDGTTIVFKYHERMWKSCKEKIKQIIKNEFADSSDITLYNTEEEYSKFLKSENALVKLLSVVSAICVLICMFGFVSLVSLTCEERRKEIAIHKINGATSRNILAMFTKEYSLLLFIGAVVSFSAGYFIMQRWLEQYVKQTNIPAWLYLSILFIMALIIVICVGWQVYKASIENPAEVVKSE
jgi:hypothetical protein